MYGGRYARSVEAAFRDLYEGAIQYKYWHYSALNDLRAQYRRTALGEFWIGINLAVFVLSIGFFYGTLLHLDPRKYLPFLLVGYAFWLLFSTVVVDGCHAFIANGPLLTETDTTVRHRFTHRRPRLHDAPDITLSFSQSGWRFCTCFPLRT